MATADLTSMRLRLTYDDGVSEDGKQKFQYKSYSNINTAATPDQIYNVSQSLSGLSSKGLVFIEKTESFDIKA
ncbi:hypothetical protein JOC86_001961 [Bacillus pakistanensis]|uniref:DUF1659 domain-containing protein n=1 Tax=Rossellomorea pakistanensis TaxID=992288 RepID=A0ABS2NC33_9BACI|nr:DUF1659 domain-containing protein [Bacillus pakistanensis]MBM7585419.1 hypothetical protein [Bacillus pakistanensis]